jgi:hypothetical protein
MSAIHSVMKRLGFVKLRDYGLVLTPDGRILSIRPAVLDDGLGGRIVGWKDDDLAAMELDRWSELGRAMAAKPASLPAVARPVAVRPIAPLPATPRPAPPIAAVAAPPVPAKPIARALPGMPPLSAQAPSAPVPVVVTPAVASEPVVEEDDWEWTIAIARARAAAEEVEQAAVTARPPQRRRADTVPPPARPPQPTPARPLPAAAIAMARSAADATAKAAAIASKDPHDRPTQPLTDLDLSDQTKPTIVRAPAKAVVPPPLQTPTPAQPLPVVTTPIAAPNRSFARGKSPATVIPIPKIPRVEPGKLAPVVATRPMPVVTRPSTRFAKGTGPVVPTGVPAVVPSTVVPSNDDKTLPSLLLPPVSRSVSR